ncbi:hypothetical protein VA249_33400 [Vibrio alfacsensis]|nr:hypothetical protein VA249_33400 [Vibrio alfacsensis]
MVKPNKVETLLIEFLILQLNPDDILHLIERCAIVCFAKVMITVYVDMSSNSSTIKRLNANISLKFDLQLGYP